VLQELQERARGRIPQAMEPPRDAEVTFELLVLGSPDNQGQRHFRAQVIAPCGAGKTVVAGMLANSLQEKQQG
jgi:transcription termination factor Rho